MTHEVVIVGRSSEEGLRFVDAELARQIDLLGRNVIDPPDDAFIRSVRGTEALLVIGWDTRLPRLDAEVLSACGKLKVIVCAQDNRWRFVDVRAALDRGVALVDTSGAMGPMVAEFGLGLAVLALRSLHAHHDSMQTGWVDGWVDGLPYDSGKTLAGSRVGVVGMGMIGRTLAQTLLPLARSVGVASTYLTREQAAQEGVELADVRHLAAMSDVLFVTTQPRTDTVGAVDREAVDALSPGSLLVVLGRASTVDFTAVRRRVIDGELFLATDVWPEEPILRGQEPLIGHPAVVHTPHVAGRSLRMHRHLIHEGVRSIHALLGGGTSQWQLGPERAMAIAEEQDRRRAAAP